MFYSFMYFKLLCNNAVLLLLWNNGYIYILRQTIRKQTCLLLWLVYAWESDTISENASTPNSFWFSNVSHKGHHKSKNVQASLLLWFYLVDYSCIHCGVVTFWEILSFFLFICCFWSRFITFSLILRLCNF